MQQTLQIHMGKLLVAAFVAAVIGALCVCAPVAVAEPTTSEEAFAVLNEQQKSLDKASSRYFAALEDYDDAVKQRDKAAKELKKIEARLRDAQARLGDRARELYRTGTGSWIDVLLGSSSFGDLTQNIELINRVNESDAALIQEERELREQSREQKAILEEQVQRTSHSADEAAKSYEEAKELTKTMKATYDRLNKEEQEYIAAQAAAQAEAEAAAQAEAAAAQAEADQAVAAAVEESGGTVNDDGSITDSEGNTYSSPTEYSAATGNEIVDRAMEQLGADYVWGGVGGSDGGFDCSGLVSFALTGQNTRLGTTADFITWNEVDDPQPGDVCVIHDEQGSQHTGIYIGDGQMVHAMDSKNGVVVSDVQEGMIYVRQ